MHTVTAVALVLIHSYSKKKKNVRAWGVKVFSLKVPLSRIVPSL